MSLGMEDPGCSAPSQRRQVWAADRSQVGLAERSGDQRRTHLVIRVLPSVARFPTGDTVPPALGLKESVGRNSDFELKWKNGHS